MRLDRAPCRENRLWIAFYVTLSVDPCHPRKDVIGVVVFKEVIECQLLQFFERRRLMITNWGQGYLRVISVCMCFWFLDRRDIKTNNL